MLHRSRYELNDAPVRFFVRRQSFPERSIIADMHPPTNGPPKEFQKCILFRLCIPIHEDINQIQKDPNFAIKASCMDENVFVPCQEKTAEFEVMMIDLIEL